MQYDNIYEIKENKKDNNLKTQTLITSTKSRVPNNTNFHQCIVKMQEKIYIKKTPKKKKGNIKREKYYFVCGKCERERKREK